MKCNFCNCSSEGFSENGYQGCPEDAKGKRVIVKFRNGEVNCQHKGETWAWGKYEGEFTITSYKVIA